MDKPTMLKLLKVLPEDATELSIPNLDSSEVIFSSDLVNLENAKVLDAHPAQRGTYKGSKRRWRIDGRSKSLTGMTPEVPAQDGLEGTPIDLGSITRAE